MDITRINPSGPAATRLLRLSDEYMASLYPGESNHMEGARELSKSNVAFLGCFIGNDLAGCAAVKVVDRDEQYGEIKRLFVDPAYRGKGVSTALMRAIEDHLIRLSVKLARLEVGVKQTEALALYRKLGYTERPPFGPYGADTLSLFMEKRLRVSVIKS